MEKMRQEAIAAALVEREELKQEAIAVRKKAKKVRPAAPAAAAAAAAPPAAAAAPAPAPAPAAAAAAPAAAAAKPAAAGKQPSVTKLAAPTGEVVVVKGREDAVRMMDMMMADQEFMMYQEQLFAAMESELGNGSRMRSMSFIGDAGVRRPEPEELDPMEEEMAADMAQLDDRLSRLAGLKH